MGTALRTQKLFVPSLELWCQKAIGRPQHFSGWQLCPSRPSWVKVGDTIAPCWLHHFWRKEGGVVPSYFHPMLARVTRCLVTGRWRRWTPVCDHPGGACTRQMEGGSFLSPTTEVEVHRPLGRPFFLSMSCLPEGTLISGEPSPPAPRQECRCSVILLEVQFPCVSKRTSPDETATDSV